MIFLKSISLRAFKGVENLKCHFDDLTILAGLNNSGKTTVLEAVHILVSSLPGIVAHPHMFHSDAKQRAVNLQEPLAALGLPSPDWLMPYYDWNAKCCITGSFSDGFDVTISRLDRGRFNFEITSPDIQRAQEEVQELARSMPTFKTEFIVPPGIVTSHEDMIPGPQYDSLVRQGKAGQHWRNSLWWAIQQEGVEQFEPVRALVKQYFPDIEVAVPVLDRKQNPPAIQFKYKEGDKGPLDISQSGAGLRTFMTLARLLEQSPAEIVLFDEPDAHLHASQQAIVLDLLTDAACNSGRQVIIATHSPELISRAPSECVQWVERDSQASPEDQGTAALLGRLGATADTYLPRDEFPNVIVYVEGKKDRPFMESLIRWCRHNSGEVLPTTLVVPHKDGRFDAVALQSLARLVGEINASTRIVGVRDLDWYYGVKPDVDPAIRKGKGWVLLDLPCKELENLLCDVKLLLAAYESRIEAKSLETILDEESNSPELIHEWRINVQPRIRERLGNRLDPATKENQTLQIFDEWASDSELRSRLVAGRPLLGKVRERIRREHKRSCYPSRMFDHVSALTPALWAIADAIFVNGAFPKIEG